MVYIYVIKLGLDWQRFFNQEHARLKAGLRCEVYTGSGDILVGLTKDI